MNGIQRTAVFQNNPRRKWIWITVVILQTAGLGLVLAAMPVQLVAVSKHVDPSSLQVFQDDRALFVITLVFFSVLASLNILAVVGIWRLSRWVHRYIIIKFSVAVLLVLSVALIRDYMLLLIYVPLLCSLSFMIWAYGRILKLKPFHYL